MIQIKPVNLNDKFDSFSDHWNPRIVGELNDQLVKIVKVKGEFIMHHHANEDELFLVIEGKLKMKLDDEILEIKTGEFVIIPKGTNHMPIAEE